MGGAALYQSLNDRWPEVKMLFITGHPVKEGRSGEARVRQRSLASKTVFGGGIQRIRLSYLAQLNLDRRSGAAERQLYFLNLQFRDNPAYCGSFVPAVMSQLINPEFNRGLQDSVLCKTERICRSGETREV